MEDRSKRQLPTTITPERSDVRKKRLESDGEQLKEKSPGKVNSRKIFFAESSTVSDSSNPKSGIAGTETFYTQTLEQATLTLAGQGPIFCRIIVVWKILRDGQALILNPNGEVIVQKMFDNTTQAN